MICLVTSLESERLQVHPKSSATTRKDCASVAAISLSLARSGLSALIVQVANQVKNESLRTPLANSAQRPLFAEPEWENHSCNFPIPYRIGPLRHALLIFNFFPEERPGPTTRPTTHGRPTSNLLPAPLKEHI